MTPHIPLIRVVIPAFRADNTITACLEAVISALSFTDSWEIIVVDNGQNTSLEHTLAGFPVTVLQRYQLPSAAYARNEGARGFKEGILVFIDSDVVCEDRCIRLLIEPIIQNTCDATIGNYSKNLRGLTFSQKYKQLYINHIYNRDGTEIRNDFWTAISAVKASVFAALHGFDTSFKGANGEDQEFGIRLTKNGFTVESVREANGQHRNKYGVYPIIRNDFRKGITAMKNSLNNRVSLSDNRHARTTDILAVVFSVLAFGCVVIGFIQPVIIFGVAAFGLAWLLSRRRLALAFLRHEGAVFCLKALILMFVLDVVRSSCVAIGIVSSTFGRKKM